MARGIFHSVRRRLQSSPLLSSSLREDSDAEIHRRCRFKNRYSTLDFQNSQSKRCISNDGVIVGVSVRMQYKMVPRFGLHCIPPPLLVLRSVR